LTGCSTISENTQTVKVPITVKCKSTVTITEIPDVFSEAKKEDSLLSKTEKLISENHYLRGQNKELKAALSECTK
jgi:hypothetical protein